MTVKAGSSSASSFTRTSDYLSAMWATEWRATVACVPTSLEPFSVCRKKPLRSSERARSFRPDGIVLCGRERTFCASEMAAADGALVMIVRGSDADLRRLL